MGNWWQLVSRCVEVARKGQKNYALILLVIGISALVVMFLAEVNFHFIAGFRPEAFGDPAIFWTAEFAQLVNTFGFMGIGAALVIAAIFAYRKNPEEMCNVQGGGNLEES